MERRPSKGLKRGRCPPLNGDPVAPEVHVLIDLSPDPIHQNRPLSNLLLRRARGWVMPRVKLGYGLVEPYHPQLLRRESLLGAPPGQVLLLLRSLALPPLGQNPQDRKALLVTLLALIVAAASTSATMHAEHRAWWAPGPMKKGLRMPPLPPQQGWVERAGSDGPGSTPSMTRSKHEHPKEQHGPCHAFAFRSLPLSPVFVSLPLIQGILDRGSSRSPPSKLSSATCAFSSFVYYARDLHPSLSRTALSFFLLYPSSRARLVRLVFPPCDPLSLASYEDRDY